VIATVRTAPVEGVTTWAFDGEASTPYVGFDELRATIDDLYMKLAGSPFMTFALPRGQSAATTSIAFQKSAPPRSRSGF
jgi:hypothetical protein